MTNNLDIIIMIKCFFFQKSLNVLYAQYEIKIMKIQFVYYWNIIILNF